MMRSMSRWLSGTVGAALVLMATTASAQVIGTFSWQLAPHCNVVTLTVEQVGATFRVHGFDDQCGAAERASASGAAHLNPNGTVGLAFVVTRPDGLTIPASARVNIATVSGTWADEFANSGTFVFNPPSPTGGQPRRLMLTGFFVLVFEAAGVNDSGFSAISFSRMLPADVSAVSATNVIARGGAATANCPGSFSAPKAVPGQLCLYESVRNNISSAVIFNADGEALGADRTGAGLIAFSAGAGEVAWLGRWAVTIP